MRSFIAIVCLTATACSATKKTTESVQPSTTTTTSTQTAAQTATQVPEPVAPKSGEELYGQICVTCHGKTGDGKGLEQQLFSFATPEDEWTNGPTVEGILKTLSEGVHDSSMAAFPEFGTAEREAIAAYVLQLRGDLLGE